MRIFSRFGEFITVEVSVKPSSAWRALPVLRVKVGGVRGKCGQLHPIDIPVEIRGVFGTLVGHGDLAAMLEWHREIGIQSLFGRHYDQGGLKHRVGSKPESEEVANRRLHAWRRLSVPIHAEHNFLQMI